MSTQTKKIVIRKDGKIEFIYDDRLRQLTQEGNATTRRASHVEPGDPTKGQNPLKWYADLSPSNGPVLGGFEERQEALDAEVAWLNEHIIKAGIQRTAPLQ